MDNPAVLVIELLLIGLQLYFWLIMFTVVVSWLVAFDVLNIRNKWVNKGCVLLNDLTNPLVRPLRRLIPPLGGIDLTPMVIIFGIYFLMDVLTRLKYSMLAG